MPVHALRRCDVTRRREQIPLDPSVLIFPLSAALVPASLRVCARGADSARQERDVPNRDVGANRHMVASSYLPHHPAVAAERRASGILANAFSDTESFHALTQFACICAWPAEPPVVQVPGIEQQQQRKHVLLRQHQHKVYCQRRELADRQL